MTLTLADFLIRAIEQQRGALNSSRIANGEPGRVEIHVNLQLRRVRIQVLVPEGRKVA